MYSQWLALPGAEENRVCGMSSSSLDIDANLTAILISFSSDRTITARVNPVYLHRNTARDQQNNLIA